MRALTKTLQEEIEKCTPVQLEEVIGLAMWKFYNDGFSTYERIGGQFEVMAEEAKSFRRGILRMQEVAEKISDMAGEDLLAYGSEAE